MYLCYVMVECGLSVYIIVVYWCDFEGYWVWFDVEGIVDIVEVIFVVIDCFVVE